MKILPWQKEPVFCFTSDVDWASETCIQNLLEFTKRHSILPTVFSTHSSTVLEVARIEGSAEVGIHPNFLPGSSHGDTITKVFESQLKLVPGAKVFRSHCFHDNSFISQEALRCGLIADSNLCTFLDPELKPIKHASGLVRLPVFWEDDSHWSRGTKGWDFSLYANHFFTPGLKILNVHPFIFALNIPDAETYLFHKQRIQTIDANQVSQLRHPSSGPRTFLKSLITQVLNRGYQFWSVMQILEMFDGSAFVSKPVQDADLQV